MCVTNAGHIHKVESSHTISMFIHDTHVTPGHQQDYQLTRFLKQRVLAGLEIYKHISSLDANNI